MKERAHNLKFHQVGKGGNKSDLPLTSLCPEEKACAKPLKTQLTETTTHRKGLAAWNLAGQSPAETTADHSQQALNKTHSLVMQHSKCPAHHAEWLYNQPYLAWGELGESSVQMEKGTQKKPIQRLAQMLGCSGRCQSSYYKDVWQTKEDTLKQIDDGRPQHLPGGYIEEQSLK